MKRYIPPKIEDIGLEEYLNNTKHKHSGYDYSQFVSMLDKGVNKSNIARLFGVDRKTIVKWLVIKDSRAEK